MPRECNTIISCLVEVGVGQELHELGCQVIQSRQTKFATAVVEVPSRKVRRLSPVVQRMQGSGVTIKSFALVVVLRF